MSADFFEFRDFQCVLVRIPLMDNCRVKPLDDQVQRHLPL